MKSHAIRSELKPLWKAFRGTFYLSLIVGIWIGVVAAVLSPQPSQAHRTLTRAQAESMAYDRAEWDCGCGSRFYMRSTQWTTLGEHSYYFMFRWQGNGVPPYCWTTVRIEHRSVVAHHTGC